jgi:hypothetical protein
MSNPFPDMTKVRNAATSMAKDAGSFRTKAEIIKAPTKSKK